VDILDDEQELLDSLQDYLSDTFEVTCYDKPENLLKNYEERAQADVVVCDIRMPKMNGHEIVKKLRQKYQDLPIIMISGFAEKPDVIKALNSHVDAFIEKPFSLGDLEEYLIDQYSLKQRHENMKHQLELQKHINTCYKKLLELSGFRHEKTRYFDYNDYKEADLILDILEKLEKDAAKTDKQP